MKKRRFIMIGFYNYTVILTYIGFASGVSGIIAASGGKSGLAVICLMIAGLCDAFDGRIAATKKDRTAEQKLFGIQIDSLSDVVCFGILPAVIGYSMNMKSIWQVVIIVLYALAALVRLAFFNVLESGRKDGEEKIYHGLPVTTAALVFPFCYVMKFLNYYPDMIYTAIMFITGVAFITDFTFKKPTFRGVLIMIGLGLLEAIFIILVQKGIIA